LQAAGFMPASGFLRQQCLGSRPVAAPLFSRGKQ